MNSEKRENKKKEEKRTKKEGIREKEEKRTKKEGIRTKKRVEVEWFENGGTWKSELVYE